MIMNLYSTKTIEEYSKALYIKLKLMNKLEDITKRQNSLLLRVSCSRTHQTVFNGE